jgi:NitT/TauT family transport system permease protein
MNQLRNEGPQAAGGFAADEWLRLELTKQASLRRRHVAAVWFWRVAVIGGALALWQLTAARGWIDPFFISSPVAVGKFLAQSAISADFWKDVSITIQETLLGVVAAAIVGIAAAFVIAQSRLLQDVVDPILSFLNSLPRVAFAPLFVAFFGLGMFSKVVLAFSLCFFIVLEGVLTGIKGIDPDLVLLTRQLGGSRLQHYTKLVIPNAVPSIFAALRLSLIYGFLAVVVGEMIGANNGLGQQIAYYSGVLRTDAVFGLLFVLGIVAAALAGALRILEARLLRWQ